jgi:outer membrane lipoprotein-sorting protein
MTTPRTLCCVAAITPFLATSLTAQSLDDIFARLDKTAQQFHSVSADIKRTNHLAVINEDSTDYGTMKLKREKSHDTRMLVDLTMPDPRVVAIDATTVQIFYPKIKTAQIYDIAGKRALVDRVLLMGFGATSAELKAEYDVSWVGVETIGGQATGHIQLTPKSKDELQHLKKADLWIAEANGLPLRQRFVTSASGDSNLVDYSNVKFNPPLSDNSLKLNLPKGVQIQHPQL